MGNSHGPRFFGQTYFQIHLLKVRVTEWWVMGRSDGLWVGVVGYGSE